MSEEVVTKEIEQQGGVLVAQAQGITVRNAETFQQAGVFLRTIAGYLKRVAEVFDPVVEAAHKAHKVAVEQRKKMAEPAQTAERLVKAAMGAYETAERERAAKAQREADAERRRLEDEERLHLASVLETQGKAKEAELALTAPVAVRVPPSPVVVMPRAEGVSFREDWDFEIEDALLIPREYLIPDEKLIRATVKAQKAETKIPGIKAVPRTITSVRA